MIWRDAWAIVAAGGVGVLLLQPFVSHYLPAAREVQSQYRLMLRALNPNIASWLDMGPRNWFWGRIVPSRVAVPTGTASNDEHLLGIGLLTSIACGVGLYLGRIWPICPLAAVTAFIVWLTMTYMPGSKCRFWRPVSALTVPPVCSTRSTDRACV